jgi:hypothetical protein
MEIAGDAAPSGTEPPHDEGALAGFTRIAASIDHALDQYTVGMEASQLDSIVREEKDLRTRLQLPVPEDPQAQRAYIAQVAAKVEAHRLRQLAAVEEVPHSSMF